MPQLGPPTTPNELMWGELMLQAVARTKLSPDDQLRTLMLINGYVREQARLAVDPAIAAPESPEGDGQEYFQLLRTVMTPNRHPMFCRLITSDEIGRSISYTDADSSSGWTGSSRGWPSSSGRTPRPSVRRISCTPTAARFAGFDPVPVQRAANAYVRSIEGGARTGRTFIVE